MLGFQSAVSARVILGGIELIHMMRKGQAKYACHPQPSLAERFDLLAAWICDEEPAASATQPYMRAMDEAGPAPVAEAA